MPTSKEIYKQNCLNCSTELNGGYCHVCGQKNIEVEESVWHAIIHFFLHLVHFDNKFFKTAKYLFLKPGLLTKEFIEGRRVTFTNPVQLYLFTSAIYILLKTSFFLPSPTVINKIDNVNNETVDSLITQNTIKDTPNYEAFIIDTVSGVTKMHIGFQVNIDVATVDEYDSLCKIKLVKHGFIKRYFVRKVIIARNIFFTNPSETLNVVIEKLFHLWPYILFVSIPLIASVLKLLYINNIQFSYMAHTIFMIYLYSFLFIVAIIIMIIKALYLPLEAIIYIIFPLVGLAYTYLAMFNYYKQNVLVTTFKYIIFIVTSCVIISLIAVILIIVLFLYTH